MPNRILLAILMSLLPILLVTEVASAQDPFEQQVIRQFEEMEAMAAENDAVRVGPIHHGMLREGESDVRRFDLEAGVEYVLVGACDDDCDDLSMSVYGPQGGAFGAGDGDRPFVRILGLPRSITVQVEVDMSDCSDEPCRFGVALYAWGDGQG